MFLMEGIEFAHLFKHIRLALISKKQISLEIVDIRAISLRNVVDKFLTKAITNMLKDFLQYIISENQSPLY